MLEKLILKNINVRNYFIYLLSQTLYIMVIFILLALWNINETANIGDKSENVGLIFGLYYILLFIIGTLFMIYALKCYIKTRATDYSVFRMLGATKWEVFKILLLELTIVMTLATVFGIIFGGAVVKCLAYILEMNGTKIRLPMHLVFANSLITVGISFALFLLTDLYGIFQFFRGNISKIMAVGVKREYGYRYMDCLSIVGVMIMCLSIVGLRNASFMRLLFCMVLCLGGAYIFISYGMSLFLKILKFFSSNMYLKNIVCINDSYFKYNTIKKLICITFLINFIVIFVMGGMIITTSITDDYDSIYPFDTVLVNYGFLLFHGTLLIIQYLFYRIIRHYFIYEMEKIRH